MAGKFPTPQERAMAWLLEATEIGGMRSFIKVSHERFTLILRKGMLPFHWIAESHVFPDKGYVTSVRERANYGAVWALSSMGALDQVMPSIWEDIKLLDERMD